MIRPIIAIGLICILVSFQSAWGRDFQPAQEIDNVVSIVADIIRAPCDLLALCLGVDGPSRARTQPPKRCVPPGKPAKKVTKEPTSKEREPAQEPTSEPGAAPRPGEPGKTVQPAEPVRPARPATAPATPTPQVETFERMPEPLRAPGTPRIQPTPAAPDVERTIKKRVPSAAPQWMPSRPVYPWTPPRFPKPCW